MRPAPSCSGPPSLSSPFLARLGAAIPRPDHPGHHEAILVSGSRVLASGAIFAGLTFALGGGHLAIATIAALPFLARLSHLVVPELLRRYGSGRVAASATWLERAGLLVAALFGIIRPDEWALAGFLAGLGVGLLGQAMYDASLASLHTEATSPSTFGRYTATKTRWAATSGLVLGIAASFAVDATERLGVPPHAARGMAIAVGVLVHLFASIPLAGLRRVAARQTEELRAQRIPLPTPRALPAAARSSWLVVPRSREQWAVAQFALAWGFAFGISTRQGEAMAISLLGVTVGGLTMLNALLVGAGIVGAKTWGRLADRFGGKGLMSIALIVQALDPAWLLAAMLIHPALLIPAYAIWGMFNSGWNIALSLTLLRTTGHPADRVVSFIIYNVAFGIAAGTAPMLGGVILELLDTRYSATVAYGVLFSIATVLRLATYPLLRTVPAPPSRRGRYVSAVVLRAVWGRARRVSRALARPRLTVVTQPPEPPLRRSA